MKDLDLNIITTIANYKWSTFFFVSKNSLTGFPHHSSLLPAPLQTQFSICLLQKMKQIIH